MQHPGCPGQDADEAAEAHRRFESLRTRAERIVADRKTGNEDQGREDCSIQAVLARILINQLWPTGRLEILSTRAERIAASRLSSPGCQ